MKTTLVVVFALASLAVAAERQGNETAGRLERMPERAFADSNGGYVVIGDTLEVASSSSVWRVDHVMVDRRITAQGLPWTGFDQSGQPVDGTLRLMLDPAGNFRLEISQAGVTVADVEVDPGVALEAMISWPFKRYCGCNNLNTICASNANCTTGAACPGTPGQICRWHIIFDPWATDDGDPRSGQVTSSEPAAIPSATDSNR